MKLFVVAIRDSAAVAFGIPQFCGSRGTALRSFTDACNDPQSAINKHPEDYELYCLGEYDDSSAAFYPLEGGIEMIARAKDLIGQKALPL